MKAETATTSPAPLRKGANEKKKVIIIGLDGGTWNIIHPLIKEGKLKHFKKLVKEGVHGVLKSTIPPVTGPAWTSFSTGRNPGKHGIYDFIKIENNDIKLFSSKDVCETFYDVLSRNGYTNVIIGLPLSYPPHVNFKGIMISDFLYPYKKIYPEKKSDYLNNYDLFAPPGESQDDYLNELLKTASNRIKTAKEIFENELWDLFFLWFGESDWCLHRFWTDIKNNTALGKKSKNIFELFDTFLGWIIKRMKENYCIFIISDHGFNDCHYSININKILLNSGLLKTYLKDISTEESYRFHLAKISGINLKKISIPKTIMKLIKSNKSINKNFNNLLKKIFGKYSVIKYETRIDYSKSQAFCPTPESMGIYVKDTKVKEKQIEYIIQNLTDLKYNEKKVFKNVLRKKSIYFGPYIDKAPDILLIPNGFSINCDVREASNDNLFQKFQHEGYHDSNGIFVAYGSNIKKSIHIKNPQIYDIAPTILHIFGLSIPKDLDGQILYEIFK